MTISLNTVLQHQTHTSRWIPLKVQYQSILKIINEKLSFVQGRFSSYSGLFCKLLKK